MAEKTIAYIGTPIAWWHFRRQYVSYDAKLEAEDEFENGDTLHIFIYTEQDLRGRHFDSLEYLPNCPSRQAQRDLYELAQSRVQA